MDSRKNTENPRFDRKALILTVVGALLVIAIIVIAVVLMQRSGGSYEENYAAAMESYVAGDYSAAYNSARLAYAEDATEEAALLLARSSAALGDYAGAVAVLEEWLDANSSGSAEAAALLGEYRAELEAEPTGPVDENSVLIGGRAFDRDTDTVVLSGVTLSGADLEAIASLENLVNLSLNSCGLTGIGALAGCTGLETLSLEDNAIEDVSALAELGNLRALYLSGNRIGSLEPLYGLDGLETLDIRGREITDAELEELRGELPACSILTDEPTVTVEELSLGGVDFKSDVTELDLSGRSVSDISVLAKCAALERLDLSGNVVSSISALASLPNLREADLSDNEISNISPLIAITGLESLDLSGNAVSSLSALSGHTALKSLALDGNPLSNVDALSTMTGLTTLSLADTGLTDAMLAPLYSLSSLASLNLEGNRELSAAAVKALAEALPGCEIAVSEEIYSVELGGESFPADSTYVDAGGLGLTGLEGMERFTALQVLVLDDNPGIDLSLASNIAGITSLELSRCALTDISALSALGSLNTLSLMQNQLTDISPLRYLRSLTELHLSLNASLSDISALSQLTGLTVLSLNGTAVTDLSPIAGLTGLQTLDIEGCQIESIEPLLGLTGLNTLYAAGCGLSQEDVAALGEALPSCTIYT